MSLRVCGWRLYRCKSRNRSFLLIKLNIEVLNELHFPRSHRSFGLAFPKRPYLRPGVVSGEEASSRHFLPPSLVLQRSPFTTQARSPERSTSKDNYEARLIVPHA